MTTATGIGAGTLPFRPVPTTLVTGAAGLVGSHVTRLLLERGDHVRVTMRERTNLANPPGLEVETVLCDVLDRRGLRRALRGVDKVFHVAGLTSLRAPAAELARV